MHTPKTNIDYTQIATEIAEWTERNYGYFVNKDSDKIKIIQDFAEQLARLPTGAMSYIAQVQNNLIDAGINRPPSSVAFIQDLKIIYNQNQKTSLLQPVIFDKVKLICENLYKIKNDFDKIKYIKTLSKKGFLRLKKRSIASMEIEAVLKRNSFNENEIREIIGS